MSIVQAGTAVEGQSAELPVLSDRQYRLWVDMLENRIGVRIAVQREGFVRAQIARRMAECGALDADTYFREVLETIRGTREWGVLLDRLLVKETSFFRHQSSHNCVRDRVAARATVMPDQPYNIWSVGCATGEESYSLAMDAHEGFTLAGIKDNYSVIGTDVSSDAIAAARAGIYPLSRVDSLSPAARETYFTAVDDRYLVVKDFIKKKVAFLTGNILEKEQQYFNQMDLIFCQNVLIYFKRWRRRDIVNMFAGYLKPGGCLIIGPGELTDWEPENLMRMNAPDVHAYEKIA